jgi:hypothetical protein
MRDACASVAGTKKSALAYVNVWVSPPMDLDMSK